MIKNKILDKIKNANKVKLNIPNFNEIVNKEFAKLVRESFNMTQKVFAASLGVSEKTIEKWESGDNRIKGAAARLLYLLAEEPKLMDKIYSYETISVTKNKKIDYFESFEKNVKNNFSVFWDEEDINNRLEKLQARQKKVESKFLIEPTIDRDTYATYIHDPLAEHYQVHQETNSSNFQSRSTDKSLPFLA